MGGGLVLAGYGAWWAIRRGPEWARVLVGTLVAILVAAVVATGWAWMMGYRHPEYWFLRVIIPGAVWLLIAVGIGFKRRYSPLIPTHSPETKQ